MACTLGALSASAEAPVVSQYMPTVVGISSIDEVAAVHWS